MSEFEFPSFPQATEDARALLSRLYREIGVTAVAAALELAPEAPRPCEALASLQDMAQDDRVRAA